MYISHSMSDKYGNYVIKYQYFEYIGYVGFYSCHSFTGRS